MSNLKNKKRIVPLVILLVLGIVVVGAIYGAYRFGRQKPSTLPPAVEQTEEPTEVEEPAETQGELEIPKKEQETTEPLKVVGVNFSQAGNLLNKEGWILLYEEPGNPALDVNLKFTNDSLCDLGKGELPCDTSKFEHGSRVQVEGNKSGKEVTVVKLKKL